MMRITLKHGLYQDAMDTKYIIGRNFTFKFVIKGKDSCAIA